MTKRVWARSWTGMYVGLLLKNKTQIAWLEIRGLEGQNWLIKGELGGREISTKNLHEIPESSPIVKAWIQKFVEKFPEEFPELSKKIEDFL